MFIFFETEMKKERSGHDIPYGGIWDPFVQEIENNYFIYFFCTNIFDFFLQVYPCLPLPLPLPACPCLPAPACPLPAPCLPPACPCLPLPTLCHPLRLGSNGNAAIQSWPLTKHPLQLPTQLLRIVKFEEDVDIPRLDVDILLPR